jgi:hypothetical protein
LFSTPKLLGKSATDSTTPEEYPTREYEYKDSGNWCIYKYRLIEETFKVLYHKNDTLSSSSAVGWGSADKTLAEKVKGTAHINLSDSSADRDKVCKIGGSGWGGLAIKVRDTKDVDVAAVGGTGATSEYLALLEGGWHSYGSSEEGESGDE